MDSLDDVASYTKHMQNAFEKLLLWGLIKINKQSKFYILENIKTI